MVLALSRYTSKIVLGHGDPFASQIGRGESGQFTLSDNLTSVVQGHIGAMLQPSPASSLPASSPLPVATQEREEPTLTQGPNMVLF